MNSSRRRTGHPNQDRTRRWQSTNIFRQFLLSEPVQRRAVAHGLRPVHPGVDIDSADSPFQIHADKGIQIDVHACAAPSPVVIEALKAL